MSFDFAALVNSYMSSCGDDKYHCLRAWEFVWDWAESVPTWPALADSSRIEKTALYLGFYLANWGMFRGSSRLLTTNLRFIEDLVGWITDPKHVAKEFWETKLMDFASDSKRASACDLMDRALAAIREFEKDRVTWTDTLVSKILLALWGHSPAFDTYFQIGLRAYLAAHPHQEFRCAMSLGPSSMCGLARLVERNGWRLVGPRTHHGKHPYPAGKLVDMAFFQYGRKLRTAGNA